MESNLFVSANYNFVNFINNMRLTVFAALNKNPAAICAVCILCGLCGIYLILKAAVIIKSAFNYSQNKKLSFTSLINGQAQGNASKVKMGFFKGKYNGCGWICAYNYLYSLGVTVHPSSIVEFFEKRGAIAGGMFGVTPNSVSRFIRANGVKINTEYFPDKSRINSKVKESKIAVVFYAHSRGAHFITVKWDSSNEAFIIYNSSNNITSAILTDSLQDYLGSRRIIALLYTV